jgi:hypothetical protein
MSVVLKWFVRLALGAAALASLAFLPLAVFFGGMATDALGTAGCAHGSGCARDTIRTAYLTMATPLILCVIFIIALVWVERPLNTAPRWRV